MKKSIWRQCTSKRRYRDEHTANHYRKIFERKRGKELDYYWCVYCRGYHLTSAESYMAEIYLLDRSEADCLVMEI